MAVIETYTEHEEQDCILCPDQIVRLDEIVTLAPGRAVHADCYQATTPDELAPIVASIRSQIVHRQIRNRQPLEAHEGAVA